MKRTVPLLITGLSGLVLVVSSFIPAFQNAGEEVAIWFDILAAIAFVLGGGNLLKLHLQHISDREEGWGYSGVTLIFFVATLLFGLIKLGSPPEPSVEAFGESFVSFPLASLPEFRVPGTIPPRADGALVPKSVRLQLSEEAGDLVFRGWMQKAQRDDLAGYQDLQEWKCLVEKLHALAQPPAPLQGKLRYDPNQRAMAFTGFMTAENRQTLLAILPASEETTLLVDRLSALATKPTASPVVNVPPGFQIPPTASQFISLRENVLEIRGPMTVPQRQEIVGPWSNAPVARPLPPAARQQLLTELSQSGPITENQQTAFTAYFDAVWNAEQLVTAVNLAGVQDPKEKTACELLSELQAGVPEPELTTPAPPPVALNDAQKAAIEAYTASTTQTEAELLASLTAAGPLTAAQAEAVTTFFKELPTLADQRRGLCFRLLETGPLTTAQINFLLDPARKQFAWRHSVGELFVAAHQVKYPWSGDYTAQGTPFWWLYEYLFQPLLTTTFAVLAFYVASAAFRAFRAKNLEAVLLLGTAFLILLGRTSAGPLLTSWLPPSLAFLKMDNLMVYIMSIFNTAGNRAIMIGIALGTVSTSLRVLLGVDRSYLGSGKD